MSVLDRIRVGPNQIIIRQARLNEQTKGGIVLPEKARESLPWGEIVAVGELVEEPYQRMQLAAGQTIYWPGFAGTKKFQLDLDGQTETLVLLDCHDLGFVDPGDEKQENYDAEA